jgi:hypothetical protein
MIVFSAFMQEQLPVPEQLAVEDGGEVLAVSLGASLCARSLQVVPVMHEAGMKRSE